jgi:hypothetical protein
VGSATKAKDILYKNNQSGANLGGSGSFILDDDEDN